MYEFQINDTDLLGTDVYHSVTRVREGYVQMNPIPGEFLRIPYEQPQV